MKKFLLIPLILLGLWSCSSDSDLDSSDAKKDTKVINVPELNLSLKLKNERITFDNQAALDAAIAALNQYESNALEVQLRSAIDVENPILVSTSTFSINSSEFKSLSEDFEDAMAEAESYYDTEEGYKEFKAKHPGLFFPEHDDDYSAYLPVSNKAVAKFLNVNGEVEIGGEVKNLRDINSYQQLVDLEIVPVDSEMISTRAQAINRLDEVRCNNRKLWVKCWSRPGRYPVGWDKIVEVCFRKKGFMGAWYNYSSESSIGWAHNGARWERSGASSHQYVFPAPALGGFGGTMWVQFRGFGNKCGGNKYYFNVNL